MSSHRFEDAYPRSPAYRDIQPLRIPAGWRIGWNTLDIRMNSDLEGIGGSSVFNATNEGRRFNLDVEFRPEFDPEGAFHLKVLYQPWPRTERGRRIKDAPFGFDANAELVHQSEIRDYAAFVDELEYWIARCTVWEREGN